MGSRALNVLKNTNNELPQRLSGSYKKENVSIIFFSNKGHDLRRLGYTEISRRAPYGKQTQRSQAKFASKNIFDRNNSALL